MTSSPNTPLEDGRVGKPTRLSSTTEPQEGLRPTGFDPSRITEAVSAIDAKLLEPIIRKAADEFYCTILETAQDYLKENLDWNLRSHLEMLERENQRMRTELYEVDRIVGGNQLSHTDRIEGLLRLDAASVERLMMIMAVERKHEGETRYETALRYIREREARDSDRSGEAGETREAGLDLKGESAGPKDIAQGDAS